MLFDCYQVGWICTLERKIKLYSGYPFLPRKLFIATKHLLSLSFYGLGIWHNLAGTSGSEPLVRLHFRVSAGLLSSQGPTGEGCASKFTQMFVGKNSFPCGLWGWGPLFFAGCQLEAYVSFWPFGLLHEGAHSIAVGFHQSQRLWEEEIEQDASAHV